MVQLLHVRVILLATVVLLVVLVVIGVVVFLSNLFLVGFIFGVICDTYGYNNGHRRL